MNGGWFSQDNIKDKMRSIPIEVSAEIVGTKRQKTRNGLSQLMPILDSSQPSKDVIEVNIRTTTFIFKLMTKGFTVEQSVYMLLLWFVVAAGQLCERGMWKWSYLPE